MIASLDSDTCNEPVETVIEEPAEEGSMMRQIAPPYLILCNDGASLSSIPKADENGQAIFDEKGRYIDAETGESVQCGS